MSDLTEFLREHQKELNLTDISRRAGLSSTYCRQIVNGRWTMTPEAEKKIRPVLEAIVKNYPKG